MTLTNVERARCIEDIALEIARHRMDDTQAILPPEQIVTREDRAVALRIVRIAEPLYPLPVQTEIPKPTPRHDPPRSA
jgi:hypothetical protein